MRKTIAYPGYLIGLIACFLTIFLIGYAVFRTGVSNEGPSALPEIATTSLLPEKIIWLMIVAVFLAPIWFYLRSVRHQEAERRRKMTDEERQLDDDREWLDRQY